jgi:hypothetical protein
MVAQQSQEYASIGKTHPVPNHVHDLVHELSKRLDAVWRYDQYIDNSQGMQELQDCWRQIKQQDEQVVQKLKNLLGRELQKQGGQAQGGRMGQMMDQPQGAAQTTGQGMGQDRPI